ncbi:hypothetical protein [Micrococcoides hystricis]|uniref:Uncharacterized protein n=1 Tax=Micrococcoides hystricis TaxID=1572761 RepID=A0ABV6PA93_9MICC
MRRVKGESQVAKNRYDHILLLWAVLLGGGILVATVMNFIRPELGYPMAILFFIGFIALWLLSPALSREKAMTHFEPTPAATTQDDSKAASSAPAPTPAPQPEHAGHPLTQSTPVLIVDEEQLMKFIAENPHPQTGQFSAIVKEMQKKA